MIRHPDADLDEARRWLALFEQPVDEPLVPRLEAWLRSPHA